MRRGRSIFSLALLAAAVAGTILGSAAPSFAHGAGIPAAPHAAAGLMARARNAPASFAPAAGPAAPADAAGSGPTGAAPGDWPTLFRDGSRTSFDPDESVLAPANVSALRLQWSSDSQRLGDPWFDSFFLGAPIIADGRGYLTTQLGYLAAFDAATGAPIWNFSLYHTGAKSHGIGPDWLVYAGSAGVPTYWNGTVYVSGPTPGLFAINASTGSVLWWLDLGNLTGATTPWGLYAASWSSPLVFDGSIFVGLTNQSGSGKLVRGAVVQIDLATHAIEHVFWTTPAGTVGAGVWAPLTADAADGAVWATTGPSTNGSVGLPGSILELSASNVSTLLASVAASTSSVGFTRNDGVVLTQSSTGVPMVVAGDADGHVAAFDRSALRGDSPPAPAWTLNLSAVETSSPSYDGSTLCIGTADGTLYGDGAGNLRCVDPSTGAARWFVNGSSGWSGSAIANGLVFGPNPAAFLEGNGTKAADLSWTTGGTAEWDGGFSPVVAQGFVYSVAGNWVSAYDLPLIAGNVTVKQIPDPESEYSFSTSATGGAPSYTFWWDFGDGTTAVGPTVSHAYSAAGEYNVTLQVEDAAGTSVTQLLTVHADVPLVGSGLLLPDPVQIGQTAWINLSASGPAGPYAITWLHLPPDLNPDVPSPTSMFFAPTIEGQYDIVAEVAAPSGEVTDIDFPTLWVDGPGSVGVVATPAVGTIPLAVAFHADSSLAGFNASYAWTFGDGASSALPAPTHTFVDVGRYFVHLVVTYPGGTSADAETAITTARPFSLSAPPFVDVDVGLGSTVSVDAAGGLGPYTTVWTGLPPGCPAADATQIVCHATVPGAYRVQVQVTDPAAGAHAVAFWLQVHGALAAAPAVVARSIGACGPTGATEEFELEASISGGWGPYGIEWIGPDGRTSDAPVTFWNVSAHASATVGATTIDLLGDIASGSITLTGSTGSCVAGAAEVPSSSAVTPLDLLGAGAALAAAAALAGTVWWTFRRPRG